MSESRGVNRIIIAAVVVLFAGFMLLTRVVFHFYTNSTASMDPTIVVGDGIVSCRATSARRGEIVVLRYPLDHRVVVVKRVVAVGGDVLQIHDKRLLINGIEAAEPYVVHSDAQIYPATPALPEPYRSRDQFGPFRVPSGSYFVLGDNRDQSSDSRYWGVIRQDDLRGRVVLVMSGANGVWRP